MYFFIGVISTSEHVQKKAGCDILSFLNYGNLYCGKFLKISIFDRLQLKRVKGIHMQSSKEGLFYILSIKFKSFSVLQIINGMQSLEIGEITSSR